MININNLSVSFNGDNLFDNIFFTIGDKERIGLVGKNGAGKSTLLKILCGKMEAESGDIVISKFQTIGYLPQEMIPSCTTTVLQETMKAFEEMKVYSNRVNQINEELSVREDYQSEEYERLIIECNELNEKLLLLDAKTVESQVEKVLLGLGFKRADFHRNMTEFSSGWQMRVELAKILLKKPNLILLDEPTNHLDIESISWLEDFLTKYYGSIVLVSHDRCFLDNVTKRTIEITAGKIYDYKVNYSLYVDLHRQRIESQNAQMINQQRQMAEVERFIERFRYKASKARQVQSKIKMLDKMEKITIDDMDTTSINFRFPKSPHCGRVVADIKGLSKNYGEKNVLDNIDLLIEKGKKIAFVGRNGEGKSTLSKIIVGEITDYSGKFSLGINVKIGYFAQNQAALLDGEKTVFDTIDDIARGDVRTKIRDILGGFLFSEEDIDKKVKMLSGGEKTRLALAKLMLSEVNLLVLDEPTNHLDLDSKDILKNALLRYDGTCILVSHDRDFLQGLTDILYEFSDHKIKEYHCDIFDFLEMKEINNFDEMNVRNIPKEDKKQKPISENKKQFEQNKVKGRDFRKKKSTLQKTEQEIENLEKIISAMEQKINLEGQDDSFYIDYQNTKERLADLMTQWESLVMEIENQ